MPSKPQKTIGIGVFVVSLALLISSCTRRYADFRGGLKEGQTKESILQLLGDTSGRGTLVKHDTPMFGPQEAFWDQLPEGTRMEVWTYHFSDGKLYLYFMDGEEKVTFIAFAPQGIVY